MGHKAAHPWIPPREKKHHAPTPTRTSEEKRERRLDRQREYAEKMTAKRESELAEAIRQNDAKITAERELHEEAMEDYQDIEFRIRGKERSSYSRRPLRLRVWKPHADFYKPEFEGVMRERYQRLGGDAYNFEIVAVGRKVRS